MSFKIIRNTVLLAIVVIATSMFVYNFLGLDADDIVVSIPKTSESSEQSLGDELGLGKYTVADINTETVTAIIKTLSKPESYSRSLTITTFWENGSNVQSLDCFVTGGDAHVITSGDDSTRHDLILDNVLYIWYESFDGLFEGNLMGGDPYAIDELMHLQSYETLLALDPSSILDAGYTTAFDEGCVYAEYISGEFGYRSRIYVSVATGLLMGTERYDGDTMIYHMESSAVNLASPADMYFALPS